MYVERGGGAVSLQMVEALGSIRTGAVQTAAELALVRLGKELNECSSRIYGLESDVRNHELNFNPNHLLTKRALDSAETGAAALRTRMANLKTEIEERTGADGTVWLLGSAASFLSGMVACHVASGFVNSFGALVAVPVIGLILTAICAALSGPGSRVGDLEKRGGELAKLEGEMYAHQTALGHQTRLSEIPPQLVEARAELVLIQEGITRNRSIVSSR
jgi:hypothetical protein